MIVGWAIFVLLVVCWVGLWVWLGRGNKRYDAGEKMMALTPKTYEIPPSPYGGVQTISATYPHAVGEKAPAGVKIIDIPGGKALWLTSVYVQNSAPPPPAPTVAITTEPTGSSGEVTWTTTGEVSVTACALDGKTVTPVGDTYSYSDLAPGLHAFGVSVTGPGGGPVSTSATWTVPLPPAPTVTITSEPSGASGTVEWSTTGDVTQTTLTLDGVAVSSEGTSYAFSGLSAGAHTFIVAVEGPGGSDDATAAWTVVKPPPVTGPAVVSTSAGPQLQLSGKRLFLNGWVAWPLNDHIASANGNAAALAANFAAFCKIAAANGVNCLRVRTLASDLNAGTIPGYASQAAGLVKIAQANDVPYVSFCDWAPLDGPNPGAGWAGTEANAYPLFTAIMSALGGPNATGVIWEPFNEPNGISWAQWVTAFESVITFFRGAGYVGPLILDPINWANEYDSGSFQAVWDADGDALGGTPNLLFAQHVYYEGASWSAGNYPVISQSAYPSIVTETGYYNNGTVNETFSQASAPALAALGTTLATYAGTQFFCGVWVDENTILTAPMTTSPAFSEPWGGIVKGALTASPGPTGPGPTGPTGPGPSGPTGPPPSDLVPYCTAVGAVGARIFFDPFDGVTPVTLGDTMTDGLDTTVWANTWFKDDGVSNGTKMDTGCVSVGVSDANGQPDVHLNLATKNGAGGLGGMINSWADNDATTQKGFAFYTGVWETKLWLPGTNGQFNNWVAVWLSPGYGDGTATLPNTELDALETLGGGAAFHLWGNDADAAYAEANGELNVNAWNYITVKWVDNGNGTGTIWVYYNQALVTTYTGAALSKAYAGNEQIIIENSSGQYGGPYADTVVQVDHTTVWALAA